MYTVHMHVHVYMYLYEVFEAIVLHQITMARLQGYMTSHDSSHDISHDTSHDTCATVYYYSYWVNGQDLGPNEDENGLQFPQLTAEKNINQLVDQSYN